MLHRKLASAALAYDQRCAKRERHPNIYRIGIILGAIERAEKLLADSAAQSQPLSVRQVLCACFNGRLLDVMLKAAGEPKATLGEIRGYGAGS